MAHQLTIRYDDELAVEIQGIAKREGLSRNQAVVRLLRKAAGLDRPPEGEDRIGHSLDWFIGSWDEEQAREFDQAVRDFEQIDEELDQRRLDRRAGDGERRGAGFLRSALPTSGRTGLARSP